MATHREDDDFEPQVGLDLSATGILVLVLGLVVMLVMGPFIWARKKILPSNRPPREAGGMTPAAPHRRRPAA